MTPEEWKKHNHRLKWVQVNRDEIERDSGMSLPRGLPALSEYLSTHRGAVTRGLGDNE